MATSGVTSAPFGSALIAGPRYAKSIVAGLPAADTSARLFRMASTYFATLAVTDHLPSPFGSQIAPTRGLQLLSLATSWPAASEPLFLSKRVPRLNVRWLFSRQLSF